ncbi:MAG: PqqD family protein [Bacteroidales bacterium]|nr:PqqD family protein [Bacteroidales bacterium]
MKINPELKLRTIVGESVVLMNSEGSRDMSKIMALNSTSKFLWEKLFGKDFTLEDVVNLLLDAYDVDRERAEEDAGKWVEQLTELKVIQ